MTYKVAHVCGYIGKCCFLLVLYIHVDRAPVESVLYINAYSN